MFDFKPLARLGPHRRSLSGREDEGQRGTLGRGRVGGEETGFSPPPGPPFVRPLSTSPLSRPQGCACLLVYGSNFAFDLH